MEASRRRDRLPAQPFDLLHLDRLIAHAVGQPAA